MADGSAYIAVGQTTIAYRLVHQVRGWYSGVELKMSRRQGAEEGSISESIRDRRATQPPVHFLVNPLGRAASAILGRCSLDPYQSRYGPSLAPSKIANSATAPLYRPRTWCTSEKCWIWRPRKASSIEKKA